MKRASQALVGRVWPAARRHLSPDLDLRGWGMVVLMALWVCLNVFDLLITYEGVSAGTAYEANRLFCGLMPAPLLAVPLKMSLAYLVLKLIERVETRTPYSGLAPLLLANLYLSWACLHNLHVINGSGEGLQFLRFYPLAGLPR